MGQALVRFVDGPQQLTERGRFFDRPDAIEGRPEKTEIVRRQQSYSNDALLSHETLRRLIHVRLNAPKLLKCQAFRASIV